MLQFIQRFHSVCAAGRHIDYLHLIAFYFIRKETGFRRQAAVADDARLRGGDFGRRRLYFQRRVPKRRFRFLHIEFGARHGVFVCTFLHTSYRVQRIFLDRQGHLDYGAVGVFCLVCHHCVLPYQYQCGLGKPFAFIYAVAQQLLHLFNVVYSVCIFARQQKVVFDYARLCIFLLYFAYRLARGACVRRD